MKANNSLMARYFLLFILPGLIVLAMTRDGLASETSKSAVSEQKDQPPTTTNIPAPAKLEMLTQKKIYWGHHSVGANIIKGLKDLMEENPHIGLNIKKTNNPSDFQAGILAHSGVGQNGHPKSKIDDFVTFLDEGIGSIADMTGFKFCFADILWDTDVDEVFSHYIRAMEELKMKYPDLKIIHFTCPLKRQRTTWKHIVKKILRIDDPWRYGENIKRNEFNKLLVEKYHGKDPVFDIAAIESTYPDGTRSTFEVDGKTYYSMVPDYTPDGGHLNEIGRKKLAEQFLAFLTGIE